MINIVRVLTDSLHPLQVVFFRCLFGLVAMTPWLISQRRLLPRTERIGVHLLRAALGLTATVGWFMTLALMPLAEATALSFTAPIFTSILAVLLLGEVMRLRRWTAIAMGLVGALLILRPGIEAIEPVALLAIGTALVWGGSTVLIKFMTRTESAGAIATYLAVFSTPLALIGALFVWQTPTLAQLGLAALLGAFGSIGHVCMTRALAEADATLVVPFDYLRLPLVAVIAYLAFDEVPSGWIWLGGGLIAASGIYIARREAQLEPETVEPVAAPAEPRPGSSTPARD
jgi:drug/metabolite transporter (DMT)-like permease